MELRRKNSFRHVLVYGIKTCFTKSPALNLKTFVLTLERQLCIRISHSTSRMLLELKGHKSPKRRVETGRNGMFNKHECIRLLRFGNNKNVRALNTSDIPGTSISTVVPLIITTNGGVDVSSHAGLHPSVPFFFSFFSGKPISDHFPERQTIFSSEIRKCSLLTLFCGINGQECSLSVLLLDHCDSAHPYHLCVFVFCF